MTSAPAATASSDAVLVSWVSVNHRAAPLLTALHDPASPLRGRTRRVYLCWRAAPPPDGERERAALGETCAQLRLALAAACPEVVELAWATTAAPTDHHAIRAFAEGALGRVLEENPGAETFIHLSPGTPAMHAVWLALSTTEGLRGRVELIQTADERGRAAGQPPVQRVHFDARREPSARRLASPGAERKNTALILGDVPRGSAEAFAFARAVKAPLTELLPRARAAGVLVVFVRHALPPEHARSGAFFEELELELPMRQEDVVVQRHRTSAFAGTELERVLRAQGVGRLAVAGVATSEMVAATCYDAADRGYLLTVLRDGCADPDPIVHDLFMDKVFAGLGHDVVACAEWLVRA